jgi:hypothetical protein
MSSRGQLHFPSEGLQLQHLALSPECFLLSRNGHALQMLLGYVREPVLAPFKLSIDTEPKASEIESCFLVRGYVSCQSHREPCLSSTRMLYLTSQSTEFNGFRVF